MLEPVDQPALEMVDVVKQFGKEQPSAPFWQRSSARPAGLTQAVDHITLTVRRGEIFGLLGANGSGKSTLIRLASALLMPDQGSIRVFGVDARHDERAVQRMINRVNLESPFFKKLSALENLLYAARLYDLPIEQARKTAIELLSWLGLSKTQCYEPLEHRSRGMQQKIAIARGLLTSPMLLLLDEPTMGLDPRSRQELQRFLLSLRGQHQTTIFLTTHDMDEADRLCDRVAVIDRGQIVALDTPEELKRTIGGAQHERQASMTMEAVFFALTGKSPGDDLELAQDATGR